LFAAEAAPTFTVVQIKTTKQAFASVANNYRINPLSLVKTQKIYALSRNTAQARLSRSGRIPLNQSIAK